MHVPYWYDKNQLPSLTSTLLVFFDKFNVKQVSVPPKTSQKNEYKFLFPRYQEWKVDMERSVYDTNNQPEWVIFMYEQEGRWS